MNTYSRLKTTLKQQLSNIGWKLQRMTPEERRYAATSCDQSITLPTGAEDYLRNSNPKLQELRQRYKALNWPVCNHTVWSEQKLRENLSMAWFRGDNAYVWQYRQLMSEAKVKMYLLLLFTETQDRMGLLKSLQEDGLFGCWTFRYGDRAPVSRDLIDSVLEINFLARSTELFRNNDLRVLDIGAGYGRLAHRMSESIKNLVRYDCVDAIPDSTFLCDYYLGFRGLKGKARAIPLDEVPSSLIVGAYDIAFNIHSFSECTYAAVQWWFQQIKRLEIPWLLIVPNHPEALLTFEPDGSTRDYSSLVEEAGYELASKELVYNSKELLEFMNVRDHFFLFKLKK